MLTKKIPALIYGCDYNPEHWPESVWDEDVKLMKQAGVNLVNVGIFSWTLLNPAPGKFDFGWLERVLDLLHENGIYVNLATATASPPAWLGKLHPEIRPVTAEGTVLQHGSRQAYTPNSQAYLKYACELVEALAKKFGKHPALAMWHINNEYMCHVKASYGEEDDRAFREWLQVRYGDLAKLNEAWNTTFWSQVYTDWDEITTPKATPTLPNPGQDLDFRRFMSEANHACYMAEREILRRYTPDVPVTTNFMTFFKEVDCFAWADSLDCTALDMYPDPAADERSYPCMHDLMRSLKGGQPFMLMEQSTSAVNWRPINHLKTPGTMRLWSLQAIARGADAIQFFQWRQSLAGAERFHSAMVPAVHPRPNRVFNEVCELGENLKRLEALQDSTIKAECALVLDWESWWAMEADALPRQFDFMSIFREFHDAFVDLNIAVDIVPPSTDLSKYRAVLAPSLYLIREQDAQKLTDFVKNGGIFVAGFFSGVASENASLHPGGFPGHLQKLLGLWVEEWEPEEAPLGNGIKMADGRLVKAGYFTERVHLEGAEALGHFSEGVFAGHPALTVNRHGRGLAYYVATRPKASFYRYALEELAKRLDLARPPVKVAEGVEVSMRTKGERRFLFVLNHQQEPTSVELIAVSGTDLLSGKSRSGTFTLAARDAAVIELAS